jgi:biopolymer transport protein ExbD
MRLARRTPRKARIEIVPMIDTVFFLLVFFMMASLSMTVYRGLPVDLPAGATGQAAPAESVAITVTRDGQTHLDREPVPAASVGARLRERLARAPDLAVVITADGEAAHRHVVDVLDQARGAGVSRLAIAVVPRPAERP